jgi:hypothetical protein
MMKKLKIVLTTVPMCLGLAVAQEAPSTPRTTNETATMGNTGQSFVGILVDSKCTSSGASDSMPKSTASSGSMMNRSTPAQTGRTWNSTDNNTAGTADRSGTPTSGQATDMPKRTADRARTSANNSETMTPRSSGDLNQTTPTGSARGTDTQGGNNDRDWNAPTDVAAVGRAATAGSSNWDRSCFISPTSSAFVLKLQDGRMVKIDDAGNARISLQLQSTGRVSSMNKVFRVKITGSMEGETLRITDIQM